jgi:hypothetical protein
MLSSTNFQMAFAGHHGSARENAQVILAAGLFRSKFEIRSHSDASFVTAHANRAKEATAHEMRSLRRHRSQIPLSSLLFCGSDFRPGVR